MAKIVAEPGDLIIGTLHTNNGNGLFAISNGFYTCTSQLVAKIKNNIVPPKYLIEVLRKELPRQLIPTDLVGRENFTKQQILDVYIPKPSKRDLERLAKLDSEIAQIQTTLREKENNITRLVEKYET